MIQVRVWLVVQFPVPPFTTEVSIETAVRTREDFSAVIAGEVAKIRHDAERIEVRCISWGDEE